MFELGQSLMSALQVDELYLVSCQPWLIPSDSDLPPLPQPQPQPQWGLRTKP